MCEDKGTAVCLCVCECVLSTSGYPPPSFSAHSSFPPEEVLPSHLLLSILSPQTQILDNKMRAFSHLLFDSPPEPQTLL